MRDITTPEIQALKSLPAILDKEDLMSALRISKSSLYKLLHELKAWRDEDGEWNVLRDDLVAYVERCTEAGCS